MQQLFQQGNSNDDENSQRERQTHQIIKSLQSEDFAKSMNTAKNAAIVTDLDNCPLSPMEDVASENLDPNQCESNMPLPKKHKYFLHFKKLKQK